MAASTQISLEEYLRTSFEPDAEYVDGETEERNLGEYDHSTVQAMVWYWFHSRGKEWGIRSVIEQRALLTPEQVRIPDISVFRRELPIEQVATRPQLIAIEILSPEDRQIRVQQRIQNFIDFGVENIWVIDPTRRTGWECSEGNWLQKDRFEVAGSLIYLSLGELFLRIDENERD